MNITLGMRGIIPPVITPLNADETLDEGSFRSLLEKLSSIGFPALFLCGTAGLGPALTDAVYRHVLRTAVDALADDIPLMAGIMEPSTGRALARLEIAAAEGIPYAVVSAPYFFGARTASEFITHFEACARATSMTVIPYNLPQYTHASLPVDVLLHLWERGLIAGVKESSGDQRYFEALCSRATEAGLPVFQGNKPDFARLVALGASGAVPVPANVDPGLLSRAWAAAVSGRVDGASLQAETDALWDELVTGSDFLSGALKRLADEGIGAQRLPLPWTG